MFIPDKERLAILEQILNEFRGVNAAAQRRRFKAALLRLGSVLTFELSRFLDIYYPPARKHELLHDEGWDIVTTTEPVTTESGNDSLTTGVKFCRSDFRNKRYL